ncbi:hypothetical protein DCAR_0310478 [Daucus carota subsp. sativus]|uniref:Uncharacterized protein n=1 Tax=Daucus carota subsp. sativus TaxID=79200 RepID=A0A165ZWR3_DAUCS|nr:hypothetical protein DCAR_0310478 [Daucus carota subsp. sativus]
MYPYSSSESGITSYKSSYLAWNSDDSEDMGFYVEPFPYCQEDFFYRSGFCKNWEGEDDVYASGAANLLGDYFSRFVWDGFKISEGSDAFNDRYDDLKMVKDLSDFVGWDEYKYCEGSDGLDMVKDLYGDKELYDSYGSSGTERETQFRAEHIPWFDRDYGFQDRVDEDCGAAELKSKYSQSWESWDEMGLYEQIFGDWHNMLRSDTEAG